MTKLAVTSDPSSVCRYCQGSHGFVSRAARLVRWKTPSSARA